MTIVPSASNPSAECVSALLLAGWETSPAEINTERTWTTYTNLFSARNHRGRNVTKFIGPSPDFVTGLLPQACNPSPESGMDVVAAAKILILIS
jgi:hypothetical protein